MARTIRPRDYAVEYASYLRRPAAARKAGTEKYLRRMARAADKARARGEQLTPQKLRGHKPAEHRTPRRQIGRQEYAAARTRKGHDEFIADRVERVSGHRMEAVQAHWDGLDFDHQRRIMDARRYALAHRGAHDWGWYMETYELDDDDAEIYGYK